MNHTFNGTQQFGRIKSHIGLIILFSAIYLIIYFFSVRTLWVGDDIMYHFVIQPDILPNFAILRGDFPVPVDDFTTLAISQYNHYFIANGRIIAHILVQLFDGIAGQDIFAIFNPLAYILLISLISKICNVNYRNIKGWITITILVILSLSVKMMPSTQISYVWMASLALSIVIIFQSSKKFSFIGNFFIFIYAVICGNCHDAYMPGIIFAIGVTLMMNFRHITTTKILICIGLIIGFAFIALNPAAQNLAQESSVPLTLTLINIFRLTVAFNLLLLIVLYNTIRNKKFLLSWYRENKFYLLALIGLLGFNIIIGIRNNRQLFGIELFSIIIIVRTLKCHSFNTFFTWLSSIVCVAFLACQLYDVDRIKYSFTSLSNEYMNSHDGIIYDQMYKFDKLGMSYRNPRMAVPMSKAYSWPFWGTDTLNNLIINTQLYFYYRYPDKPLIKILPAED